MKSKTEKRILLYTAKDERVKKILAEALESDHIKELISTRSLLGEPHDPNKLFPYVLSIDVMCVSHRVERFWWEGMLLYGEITVLDTRQGTYLGTILKHEDMVAFTPRMVGKYIPGTRDIELISRLITFDWTIGTRRIDDAVRKEIYEDDRDLPVHTED